MQHLPDFPPLTSLPSPPFPPLPSPCLPPLPPLSPLSLFHSAFKIHRFFKSVHYTPCLKHWRVLAKKFSRGLGANLVVQLSKPQIAMASSHIRTVVPVPAVLLLIHFPTNAPGKEVENSPSSWIPAPVWKNPTRIR